MNALYGTAIAALALASGLVPNVRAESAFTPRGFCHAKGGVVSETGDPELFICCYAPKQRCLVVNNRSRTSTSVRYLDDADRTATDKAQISQRGG